jgi:hypothetical protein
MVVGDSISLVHVAETLGAYFMENLQLMNLVIGFEDVA